MDSLDGPTEWTGLDRTGSTEWTGLADWIYWMDWTGLADRMDLDLLGGSREVEKSGEGRGVGFEENLEARANLYKNPPRRLIRTSAWCRGVTSQQ